MFYDEQSWKIAVSNRNSSNKEAGKHIETISPMKQKAILNYVHSKGYKLGKSEYRYEESSYKLKENEKWVGNKPKGEEGEIEIVLKPGISNNL